MLSTRGSPVQGRDSAQCPFNPNHEPAAPITSQYPYLGAINGQPGTGKGGILVPADGDTAHEYRAPDYSVDIRGPYVVPLGLILTISDLTLGVLA